MRIKIITLFTALLGLAILSQAQTPSSDSKKITFEKATHDFGQIKKGDPAEYTFKFTNTSGTNVKLQRVKASCGCTTPKWTQESIAPGTVGEIAVKYNSNRVGRFTKSITVTYDSVEKPQILYIKGVVEAPAPTDADVYVKTVGGLAFDKTEFILGTLDSDKTRTAEFKVKNVSPQMITFTNKVDKEEMVTVKPQVYELTPGSNTTIQVTIDGKYFDTSTNFTTKVTLFTDDQLGEGKDLTISGKINKIYTAKELAMMPNIMFERTEFKGGSIIEGEKMDITYKFTNTGGSDLVIESVKASCGCTATSPKDKIIAPGASSEIIATFDSRGRKGNQKKTITVKSNDPDQRAIILSLEALVEQDPFHAGDQGPAAAPTGRKRK
ncbi:DUF1573 domain-containing protein [bacterium]|nr:DUF1573 domain-containing protein [bacterium]